MKKIFMRSKKNPILVPDPKSPWCSVMVYNPGVIYHANQYHMFFRAVGKAWVSKIGYARSDDGINFKVNKRPALEPEYKIEKNGLEDPRISRVGTKFFMTYTAYDGRTARLCLVTSKNLTSWKRQGEIFPNWDSLRAGEFIVPWDKAQHNDEAKKHWLKAGAIFPERINGKYWLLFGDRYLWQASSEDGLHWVPEYEPFLLPRRNYFDSIHVEMGPPPMRTKKGWLIIYHGVDESMTYRLGFLLLDLHDPSKIIKRANSSIFEPKEAYETSGLVDILPGGFKAMETMDKKELNKFIKHAKENKTLPQVVFCPGAILKNKTLQIFYGAGDSVIATATTSVEKLVKIG